MMGQERGSTSKLNQNEEEAAVHQDEDLHQASENTPLLTHYNHDDVDQQPEYNSRHSAAASLLRTFQPQKPVRSMRWPSIVALVALSLLFVLIICLGFVLPSAVEEYANHAMTFEPRSLAIESFTMHGVKARIQGDITVDARRVKSGNVRRLGRFATWIAKEVESGSTTVKVSLPEYEDAVLGTADLPPITVDIRNGHSSPVDFLANLRPGQLKSIKTIADEWLNGRLATLHVIGKAQVPVKSGIFHFGTHQLSQSLTFAGKDVPAMPAYTIQRMDLHDVTEKTHQRIKGIAADVSLALQNDFAIDITIPAMGFDIAVDGCHRSQAHIQLADAETHTIEVAPGQEVQVNVTGLVRSLPRTMTDPCPDMSESPLDLLVAKYIRGEETTLWVKGARSNPLGAPGWIVDVISDIIVPVPFKGHAVGQLIRDFSLSHVNFGLPDLMAKPDSKESQPTISAVINAVINIPSEINFDIKVDGVRANADVYYHDAKLGKLDLSHWQEANSTRVESDKKDGPAGLLIQSSIENAPLEITDEDVFSDVFQALLFGGEDVVLDIKAVVDVAVETGLGSLVLREIPASGSIPIKPINRDGDLSKIKLRVGELQILDTTKQSLVLSALVNVTNPTEYSAVIPYFDVHISSNGSLLGHATTKTIQVRPGKNVNIPITAVWDPKEYGGSQAYEADSIPSQPSLGRLLAAYPLELPTPRLGKTNPNGDDDDSDDDTPGNGISFIADTTMHLLSSTAQFTLLSPLKRSTLYVTYLNATALYRDEEVGYIMEYDQPFAVAPGGVPVTSPRLPVDWSFGSVGYEAVKNALGGRLKLVAEAVVGVRIGAWEERVHFRGRGIGAKIRL